MILSFDLIGSDPINLTRARQALALFDSLCRELNNIDLDIWSFLLKQGSVPCVSCSSKLGYGRVCDVHRHVPMCSALKLGAQTTLSRFRRVGVQQLECRE